MSARDELPVEWFGGNLAAQDACYSILRMSHTWDDLIDKDKPVSEVQINQAFLTALVYLPTNPFYRHIQDAVAPMWVTIVSAYEAANQFEREKDEYGVELAFMLRCAIGNIIAYAISVCIGAESARAVIPSMWKSVVGERYSDYRKEHLNDHQE